MGKLKFFTSYRKVRPRNCVANLDDESAAGLNSRCFASARERTVPFVNSPATAVCGNRQPDKPDQNFQLSPPDNQRRMLLSTSSSQPSQIASLLPNKHHCSGELRRKHVEAVWRAVKAALPAASCRSPASPSPQSVGNVQIRRRLLDTLARASEHPAANYGHRQTNGMCDWPWPHKSSTEQPGPAFRYGCVELSHPSTLWVIGCSSHGGQLGVPFGSGLAVSSRPAALAQRPHGSARRDRISNPLAPRRAP